jgi:hypothetical protein
MTNWRSIIHHKYILVSPMLYVLFIILALALLTLYQYYLQVMHFNDFIKNMSLLGIPYSIPRVPPAGHSDHPT